MKKQVEYTIEGQDASIKVQQEVPYCGKFGEFVNNTCTVGFRSGEIINPTLFPDDNAGGVFSGTLSGTLSNIGYEKDAREIFSLRTTILSTHDNDKIKIYKGITKYNGMFTGRT